jgi:hypothetical protein
VNKLRFSWAALSLLAPILIFAALCVGPAGCGGGGTTSSTGLTPSPTAANVQVAFITNFAAASSRFQNFFLNVAGVRMNPRPNTSNTATPSETNGKWVVIPVPTATSTASGSGDVPIDVLGGLSELQVFNTTGVRNGTFTTIEVVLDTTNPGFIVPQCAGGGNLEGCARFPIQLENPGVPLKFLFPIDQQFQTVQHETRQLPILLSASVVATPNGPGQPYRVNLGVSNPSNIGAYIGTITGTVTGASGNSGMTGEHLRVTAELAGTNTIVATSDILNGTFTLFLPAAAGIGTLYDLYVSGGSTTIVGQRGVSTSTNVPLFPSPSATATVNFTVVGAQTLGGFSGQVTDACTTLPIVGATLQILTPSGSSSVDCAKSPAQCISVASANTGASGVYPLPATEFNPSSFQQVPVGSPTATYVLQISAPGYDTLFMKGSASISGVTTGVAAGHCFTPISSPTSTATPANGTCSFKLTTAYLQGTLNLTAAQPPGTATTVQVVAENTGTNGVVSALTTPLTIPGGSTSLGFTLNVPTHAFNSSSAQNFDVFAEAQDLYLGGPDPFPGHTILVQQNVGGPPTACATVSAATSGLFGATMDCVGHGGIAGTAANNPNAGTTIELSKGGVAITDAAVALLAPTATASAGYSFCIPPDSYNLQRFEQGSPAGATVAVGPMATPMATDSPCPSTCFNGSGTCPGICSSTAGPTM